MLHHVAVCCLPVLLNKTKKHSIKLKNKWRNVAEHYAAKREIASFSCQNVFKVASFCARVLHFKALNLMSRRRRPPKHSCGSRRGVVRTPPPSLLESFACINLCMSRNTARRTNSLFQISYWWRFCVISLLFSAVT